MVALSDFPLSIAFPCSPGRVPDMQDFYVVAYAIENLVRVTADKQHAHTRIVRPIATERMVFSFATASLMLAATFVAPLDAGPARLDFTGILGKLLLVLPGPGLGMLDHFLEQLVHLVIIPQQVMDDD